MEIAKEEEKDESYVAPPSYRPPISFPYRFAKAKLKPV